MTCSPPLCNLLLLFSLPQGSWMNPSNIFSLVVSLLPEVSQGRRLLTLIFFGDILRLTLFRLIGIPCTTWIKTTLVGKLSLVEGKSETHSSRILSSPQVIKNEHIISVILWASQCGCESHSRNKSSCTYTNMVRHVEYSAATIKKKCLILQTVLN